MRVYLFLTTGAFHPELAPGAGQAVAIDVLRATSVITTALAEGASAVVPYLEPEEARRAAAQTPGAVLGGERGGIKIPGFDLGNSPAEYTRAAIGGRTVLFTTSNGTRAIHAGAALGPVCIASFLNLPAAAAAVRRQGDDVAIICAGTDGQQSLEDTACGGALVEALGPDAELDDTAVLARSLWREYRESLPELFRLSRHGQRLIALGLAADLARCARVGILDAAPVFRAGRIAL